MLNVLLAALALSVPDCTLACAPGEVTEFNVAAWVISGMVLEENKRCLIGLQRYEMLSVRATKIMDTLKKYAFCDRK